MSEQASSSAAGSSSTDADMLRAMGLPSNFARASRGRGGGGNGAQPPSGPRGGKKAGGQQPYRGGKHSVARKKHKDEEAAAAQGGEGFVIDTTPSWPGQGAPRGGGAGRGRGGNDRGGRGRGRGGRGGGGGGHGGGGGGQIFIQEPKPLEQIQPLFRPSFTQDPWAHLS